MPRSSGNGNCAHSTGNGGAGNKMLIKKGSLGKLIAPACMDLGRQHQIQN